MPHSVLIFVLIFPWAGTVAPTRSATETIDPEKCFGITESVAGIPVTGAGRTKS